MRKKKLRLLMGIPHPDAKGGPPTHVPMLVDYFRENENYEVRTFYYGSRLFGTQLGQGETIPKKILANVGRFIEYIYLLAIFRPDVVHFSTAFTKLALLRDLPFAITSRIFCRKSIFKLHGCHLDLLQTEDPVQLAFIKWYFWCATKIGILSRTEEEKIAQRFGFADKLVLTKNIVTPNDPADTEGFFEKNTEAIYGLFVSRIEPLKGLQDLIRAIPAVQTSLPEFRLIVVGDGPSKKYCEDLARQLDVSDSITWLGFIDNDKVQPLYRKCDVFIFPTHYPEGMPMALIEALRAGIPIVTTPVWFGLSYLQEGMNCVFIEKGNPESISTKIVTLMQDSSLRSTMGRENPSLLKDFGKLTVGREFEQIYESMMQGR